MAHAHSVYDSDRHFLIDPITRVITSETSAKNTVVQNDHNSERFTFEIPRYIEGHDMSVCDRVEVHYLNVDTLKTSESRGVYEVDDLQISPDDTSVVIFSWLLSSSATKHDGLTSFVLRFACTTDGKVDYVWHTAIYSNVTVAKGIHNSESVVNDYADVLAQWHQDLFETGGDAVVNIKDAENKAIDAIKVAANAKTQETLDSIPDDYATLDANVTEYKAKVDSLANAIKGTVSGAIVRADDVSPVEHTMGVRAQSKNMIPYPYYYGNETKQGVEMTVSEDGTITFNGVATGDASFRLIQNKPIPVCGKYTVSGCDGGSIDTYYLQPFVNGFGVSALHDGSKTYEWDGELTSLVLFFKSGTVFENKQFKIQLERGSTATEYTPYVDPASVTVTRCGKNFWHSRGVTFPRTVSGVTVDYDADTQIYTFNGTSTSPGDIYTVPNGDNIMHIGAGETWTLRVEVMGGTVDGVATSAGKISPLVNNTEYNNTIHANAESLYVTKQYTESADITKMYFYVYASGVVFDNFKVRVQFEQNDRPTSFELFKELTPHTPTTDGTVLGVTSLSPTMTLSVDTDGALVECEYNRDTNAVITDLYEKIAALSATS